MGVDKWMLYQDNPTSVQMWKQGNEDLFFYDEERPLLDSNLQQQDDRPFINKWQFPMMLNFISKLNLLYQTSN
jgi:hypothetical protein